MTYLLKSYLYRMVQAMTILQRMLHFVQNFQYYMMFEVLEPNWIQLENTIKTVR